MHIAKEPNIANSRGALAKARLLQLEELKEAKRKEWEIRWSIRPSQFLTPKLLIRYLIAKLPMALPMLLRT